MKPASHDRSVTPPRVTPSGKVRSVPDLVAKEMLAALASLAFLFLPAAVWDAPLGGPPNPTGIPSDHVKAPWIFLGIQQLLRYLPSFWAGIGIPLALLALLSAVPWLSGQGTVPRKILQAACITVILLALGMTVWGLLA